MANQPTPSTCPLLPRGSRSLLWDTLRVVAFMCTKTLDLRYFSGKTCIQLCVRAVRVFRPLLAKLETLLIPSIIDEAPQTRLAFVWKAENNSSVLLGAARPASELRHAPSDTQQRL